MKETNNIPSHWQLKKLGEVCNVLDNLRKPINSTERQQRISGKSQEELYPYYGATGQVGWIDDFLTDGNFILIGEDGAPFLDIYKAKAYKIKGKTWVNNHAHILKGKEQFLLDDFALHYLNSINYREFVNGTTRLKLTKSSLVEIPFVVPPLPEQQAIVAKIEELLSELENGKQQLLTAQQQLKVYRQSLLKWAFEGKLTNNNVKEGELPKGWKLSSLGDICEMKAGFFVKADNIEKEFKEGLFPCYGGNGLRGYTNSFTHKGNYSLVGRQGALCGNVHRVKGIFHATEHAVVTSPKEGINADWLYYKLSAMKLNQYSAGAAQPGLSVNKLLKIEVSYPSIEEQQLIVSELESKLTVCDKIEETISQSLQQAETLKQSILKKAFEGKLVTTEKMTVVNELH